MNYVDLHLSRGDLVVVPGVDDIAQHWACFVELTRVRRNGVRYRNYYSIFSVNKMQGPACFSFVGENISVKSSKEAEYHLPYCADDGSFRDERLGGITNIYRFR